jgi:hypothetical protein
MALTNLLIPAFASSPASCRVLFFRQWISVFFPVVSFPFVSGFSLLFLFAHGFFSINLSLFHGSTWCKD